MDVICQCMEVRSSTEDSTQSRLSQLSGCSFNIEARRSSVRDVSTPVCVWWYIVMFHESVPPPHPSCALACFPASSHVA